MADTSRLLYSRVLQGPPLSLQQTLTMDRGSPWNLEINVQSEPHLYRMRGRLTPENYEKIRTYRTGTVTK